MGSSSISSLLCRTASAVTGPVVTTWRLLKMIPSVASTTKPVAYEKPASFMSKAFTEETRTTTTP